MTREVDRLRIVSQFARRTVPWVFIIAAPVAASAQVPAAGTVQVGAVTGIDLNRQTIATYDAQGAAQLGDADLTAADVGVEATWYLTPHVGIGGSLTYHRLGFEVRERNTVFRASGGFFGPILQVRLPLGDRADFVFVGSGGGVKTSLTNQNTGIGSNVSGDATGRYWLAGGGLSFTVVPRTTFDVGVRYQSSRFTVPARAGGETVPGQAPSQSGTSSATSAGLLVAAGFSVYLR